MQSCDVLYLLVSSVILFNAQKTWSLMLDYNWLEPKEGLKRYPHDKSCRHFYEIESDGSISVKKCRRMQRFDYISLSCVRKTLVHCWTSEFDKGYVPIKRKKYFRCPIAWGALPDPNDCEKYYSCVNYKPQHKICPNSQMFDQVEMKCLDRKIAVCAHNTDILDKGYKCPLTWGLFNYPQDCSKYYRCIRNKPVLKACDRGKLFNSHKGICERKEVVECGSTSKPY
ncbi:hypothetical protein X975_24100, partial [Stegodyphus mimosarum]